MKCPKCQTAKQVSRYGKRKNKYETIQRRRCLKCGKEVSPKKVKGMCPKCFSSKNTQKKGFDRRGKQRYYCKDCKKHFSFHTRRFRGKGKGRSKKNLQRAIEVFHSESGLFLCNPFFDTLDNKSKAVEALRVYYDLILKVLHCMTGLTEKEVRKNPELYAEVAKTIKNGLRWSAKILPHEPELEETERNFRFEQEAGKLKYYLHKIESALNS